MINGYKIAAVCTSRLHEEYVTSYVKALNSVLAENGWRVFIYTVNSDLYYKTRSDMGEKAVYELIDYSKTEAVIVFKNNLHDEDLTAEIKKNALANGVPVMLIDGDDPDCINMKFDYESGFKCMLRHIFDHHGIRDIHMIAGTKGVEASEVRINAVRELAKERGIEFDESRISYGDFWSRPTTDACERLIESGKLPEAVICANDSMAIAACGVFRKHGIRVPEDIIVTGFDGIEASQYTLPKISTVKCDFGKMGRESAEILIKGEKKHGDVMIMPDLHVSESCGCSASLRVDVAEVITSYRDSFERYRNDERKLNLISAKVQSCSDLDSAETELTNRVFYELVCVLKKECTDPTYDPMTVNTDTLFGKDMVVLFDTHEPYIGKDRSMHISRIIPRLDDILAMKVPLIFTVLHYIDIPLGYICFYYADARPDDYNKVYQSTAYIGSAVGGFRNMRYQNRLREWIEEMYKYDELTGLYTRKSFCREYERMLEEDGCDEMTFVLCDLDGLKYINDNFGHSEGDLAIRVVAKAMELACTGGICSKHGGDELLAAIPEIRDPDLIKKTIERFIDDFNEASTKPYKVSSSIGICTAKGGDLSFSRLFSQADDLMYTDKIKKKNTRSSKLGIKDLR